MTATETEVVLAAEVRRLRARECTALCRDVEQERDELRLRLKVWEDVSSAMCGENEVQAWYMRRLHGRVRDQLGGPELAS